MKRKIISLALASAMILGAMPVMVSAEDDYATRGEVCEMLLTAADDYNPGVVKTDILKGYEDGELHEERSVTRAEALVMLKRAFGDIPEIKGANAYLAIPTEDFTDIPEWAQTELDDVFAAGIVAGKAEGIFAPDDNVTVDQMDLFIERMYRVFGTNLKDDFFAAMNKDYLDNTVLPDGIAYTGTFDGLDNENRIIDLLKEVSASNPDKGSKEGKIKTLYDNYLNFDARNELGFDAIKPYFDEIDSVQSVSDLVDTEYIGVFLGFSVGIDMKDSTKYTNTFGTTSIISKDMYEGNAEWEKASYLKYIKTLFTLAGYSETDAAKAADDIFAFETEMAKAGIDILDYYADINVIYNPYTLDEIKAVFPTVDIEKVFENTGLKNKDRFIVEDVGSMNMIAGSLTDDNIDLLKNYIKGELLQTYAFYLSDDFVNANRTYTAELQGTEGSLSDEMYAAIIVDELLGSYVGEIYADKYANDKIKADIDGMINDMVEIYRGRITNLDWMTDVTKEKALKKLDTMYKNLVAPETWDEIALDGMELRSFEDGGSLVENIETISDAVIADVYAREGTTVDRTEWITTPQTVNAFYSPTSNSINFPVAILLIPEIYSGDASYESNLGAVGYVIGHELSHAFDRSGSQYDENGNVVNWWADEDMEAFNMLCQRVIDFYDGLEAAPGITENGVLSLTENTADISGLSVALELASTKDNFDYKAMFESFSHVWRSVQTRERLASVLSYDSHSADCIRVNRVLQSCDKFYEVYEITETDGMWIAPEDRVSIW